MRFSQRFRLAETRGTGVVCDEDGLSVGGTPLLERIEEGGGRYWRARPLAELDHDLSRSYGLPIEFWRKGSGLAAVARALNEGEVALAQMTALYLRLPDPPLLKSGASSEGDVLDRAWRLQASGLLKEA